MSIYCSIQKKFHNFYLNVEFQGEDEILALLGPSGSGKSLILRCIAGIVKPDSGRIVVNHRVLYDSDARINLSPQDRRVGLLFQDYALFPNMTVAQNITISMCKENTPSLDELLDRYHLTQQKNLYPHQLSGGQKQRCALARMMATNPELVLLDEPFSSLDSFLKAQLEEEIFTTLKDYEKTVLFVSHNKNEIYRHSDKISVIVNGTNQPMVEKHILFDSPKTYHSALLTGCKNIFPATKKEDQIFIPNLNLSFQYTITPSFDYIGIRPQDILYTEAPTHLDSQWITIPFHINSITEELHHYRLAFQINNGIDTLICEVSKDKYKEMNEQHGKIAINKNNLLFLTK